MVTISASLPANLRIFVDEQVERLGFRSGSEYVRHLIRKDQDKQRLRGLLFDGAESFPSAEANAPYFETLRNGVRVRPGGAA